MSQPHRISLTTRKAHADACDSRRRACGVDDMAELARDAVVVAKDLLGGFGPEVSVGDASSVPKGEGRVVDHGAEKVAVYRDDEDSVHAVSAVCTHRRCIVRWNPADRSWDCPCHGARFDTNGRVLQGPALHDLPAVDLQEKSS